jgi:single-strand DNA-binding protein
MSDTNIVILKGRLVKPAELKMLSTGTPCTTFTIAVGESRKNAQTNQWDTIPHYFDVTSFSNYAKSAIASLSKGQEVLVTGKLRQDRWQKDGQMYSRISVTADNLEILRAPKGTSQNAPQQPQPQNNAPQNSAPQYQPPFRQGQWQQVPNDVPQFDSYPDDIPM